MDFSTVCAPRISEERKRLKLSQDQAGDFCDVSREMWGKYERAKAAMGSDVLFMFAQAGADAQYILTGIRSGTALAADEQILLDGYRALDPATRKRMLAFVLTESGPAEVSRQIKEKLNGNGSKTITVTATGNGAQAAGRNIVNKGKNEQ
jgi:transcriptional regulator with XRE-family HTH domain